MAETVGEILHNAAMKLYDDGVAVAREGDCRGGAGLMFHAAELEESALSWALQNRVGCDLAAIEKNADAIRARARRIFRDAFEE